MFVRTLRRLTIFISLVFLLIFGMYILVLYGYFSHRLFDNIDEAMRIHANSFRLVNGEPAVIGQPIFDPRIVLLLRGDDGRTIDLNPYRTSRELEHLREITATVETGELQMREYEGHTYRMMRWPYAYDPLYNADRSFRLQSVIIVSIVDSEVQLLNNLLWISLLGVTTGTFCIVLASYFIARRVMVPVQNAWERQRQFVADASHELRSPVTGIYSNAELLLRHPEHSVQEESRRIYLIMKEAMRMTRLISSLLTLARADANTEMPMTLISISEVVGEVLELFNAVGEAKGIDCVAEVRPGIRVRGNKDRLHQLLVILLDNAFKYTQQSGTVVVACRREGRQVLLSVRDTGIGIAPELLPRIFDRFFRADKTRSRETGGTRLGLAIAKWIVDMHGGKLQVASKPGEGTIFTVLLQTEKA